MGLGISILNFILSGGKITMGWFNWFDDDDDDDRDFLSWDDDDDKDWYGVDSDEELEDARDSDSTDTD